MTSFTEKLCTKAQPYIDAQVKKPFLVGIIDGDLPVDKFKYWLIVDYPYLINFVKVQSLGIVKADDPEMMRNMLTLVEWTQREMGYHEAYAEQLNVSRDDLIFGEMGPLKFAYTRHQLAAAHNGGLGDILAAILPCKWGYGQVSRSLASQKEVSSDNLYKTWINTYLSESQSTSTVVAFEMLDQIAAQSTTSYRRKLEDIFMDQRPV